MARIRLVEDVGAPVAVAAVDLITEATAPDWNVPVSLVMAGGSYGAAMMGYGGDFMKNMGIASMPWAAKSIYRWAMAQFGSPVTTRLATKTVSRWPAPLVEQPFGGARLV